MKKQELSQKSTKVTLRKIKKNVKRNNLNSPSSNNSTKLLVPRNGINE